MIGAEDRGAWQELRAKLRPFVARRVRASADVDDVVQNVFLRMQRGLPALRDEARFGPWVYQIARSAVAEHQRDSARHPTSSAEPPELPLPAPDEEPEGAAAGELASVIAPFVAALPSPYREALTLTELQGLSQKDAAAMLGISHSGMKSRVQRGRAQLRKSLEDCCHIALDARGRPLSCTPRLDGQMPEGCCK